MGPTSHTSRTKWWRTIAGPWDRQHAPGRRVTGKTGRETREVLGNQEDSSGNNGPGWGEKYLARLIIL